MWPMLMKKAKNGGLNAIETYVFWNAHEPQRGQVLFISFIFKKSFNVNYNLLQFNGFISLFLFFFSV